MALNVAVANPSGIAGVSSAAPSGIAGIDVAHPAGIAGVANNYGLQGVGPLGFSSTPISLTPQATSLKNTTASLLAQFGPSSIPAPVYAPNLDISSVYSNAKAAATNAQNPLYAKYLNDYLANQKVLQQQEEAQTQTNLKNYQDILKQTQEANALTGSRTGEDAALKQSQIATAQDQNQQDTGTQFENDRLAAASAAGANGTLGSGVGNRAADQAVITRNTSESRQNAGFQEQQDANALAKARTFEDLANSNTLATSAEGKSEAQANFDLSKYISQNGVGSGATTADILASSGYNVQAQANQFEAQREAAVFADTQNQAKIAYTNYLNGITNPAQKAAAAQTYGAAF